MRFGLPCLTVRSLCRWGVGLSLLIGTITACASDGNNRHQSTAPVNEPTGEEPQISLTFPPSPLNWVESVNQASP